MQAMPIGDGFWRDIDTTACLVEAEHALLKRF
jgi:hypothetical protein